MKSFPLGPLVLATILVLSVVQFANAQVSGAAQPEQSSGPAKAAPQVEDISGMYSFLREGEFVQINIEEGSIVTGFLSRYGDSDGDKGAFLDQFFSKAAFDGKHLTFTTKPVHGIWFDFDGTVQRGPGKTPRDEAYRLIRGKLTQYSNDQSGKPSAKSRELEMKSFPQDFEEESSPKNEKATPPEKK